MLWGPNALPAGTPSVSLLVTSTQAGTSSQSVLTLAPPPLLLVHGIWSSDTGAGFAGPGGLWDWLVNQGNYPHSQVFGVNYSQCLGTALLGQCLGTNLNSQAFDDPRIQAKLLTAMGTPWHPRRCRAWRRERWMWWRTVWGDW